MGSSIDRNVSLPLSWKEIKQPNFCEYIENVMLLPNPSNRNEILIFVRNHLEKTHAYNVETQSYKTYKLPMWPKILFQQYNDLHQEKPILPVHYSSDHRENFLVTNGTKPDTISIIGAHEFWNGDENVHFSYYTTLNTKQWKFIQINESYHFKFFPNPIIPTSIGGHAISYKHYIIAIMAQRLGFSMSKLIILDVKNPDDAKLLKNVLLQKRYCPWVKSYIQRYNNNNSIKIVLFQDTIIRDRSFGPSFCEISFDFDTLKCSVYDTPSIQNHLTAACNIGKIDSKLLLEYGTYSQTCKHVWYNNRYLIVFGRRKIIFYDSKKGVWDKCRYDLPFEMIYDTNIILMISKQTGKEYLHFITSRTHFQLELGECKLKESWKGIRLMWIGFYKNHLKTNHDQDEPNLANSIFNTIFSLITKKQTFCMFGQLPKAIVKHIMSFLIQHCNLCWLQ